MTHLTYDTLHCKQIVSTFFGMYPHCISPACSETWVNKSTLIDSKEEPQTKEGPKHTFLQFLHGLFTHSQ